MRYLDAFVVLGQLVSKLISMGISEISEDDIDKFSYEFVLLMCKKERTFLRITRADIIRFADKNMTYLRYDRALDKLYINFDMSPAKFFNDFYASKFSELYGFEAEANMDFAITKMLSK
ncbi:MAG: hypothetical protein MJ245_06730 [Clostridia bacterium]|nr:hypothetical protein [Clostridia bacterium]